MQPFVSGDAASTLVGGMMFLFVIVAGVVLLCFLLFISPLMIWFNLRRLRKTLHDDLVALRSSVERLAEKSGVAADAEAADARPETPAVPVAAEPQKPDMIGFSCPECGKFFEGPATLSGTTYTCPECRIDFHIH